MLPHRQSTQSRQTHNSRMTAVMGCCFWSGCYWSLRWLRCVLNPHAPVFWTAQRKLGAKVGLGGACMLTAAPAFVHRRLRVTLSSCLQAAAFYQMCYKPRSQKKAHLERAEKHAADVARGGALSQGDFLKPPPSRPAAGGRGVADKDDRESTDLASRYGDGPSGDVMPTLPPASHVPQLQDVALPIAGMSVGGWRASIDTYRAERERARVGGQSEAVGVRGGGGGAAAAGGYIGGSNARTARPAVLPQSTAGLPAAERRRRIGANLDAGIIPSQLQYVGADASVVQPLY